MTYPGKAQPSDSGPGTYRFLLASAYLACQENLFDSVRFHAAVEWLVSLAWPHIKKPEHQEAWKKMEAETLVDDNGQPLPLGAPVPKAARYRQASLAMEIAMAEGVFASKRQEVDDSTDFFRKNLERSELVRP